jgi:hypothetical protein
MEDINTAPADTSFIIRIFEFKFGSISSQSLSIDVFIPSRESTLIEHTKTIMNSILDIPRRQDKIKTKMKTPN